MTNTTLVNFEDIVEGLAEQIAQYNKALKHDWESAQQYVPKIMAYIPHLIELENPSMSDMVEMARIRLALRPDEVQIGHDLQTTINTYAEACRVRHNEKNPKAKTPALIQYLFKDALNAYVEHGGDEAQFTKIIVKICRDFRKQNIGHNDVLLFLIDVADVINSDLPLSLKIPEQVKVSKRGQVTRNEMPKETLSRLLTDMVDGYAKAWSTSTPLRWALDEVKDAKQLAKLQKKYGLSLSKFQGKNVTKEPDHENVEPEVGNDQCPNGLIAGMPRNFIASLSVPAVEKEKDNSPKRPSGMEMEELDPEIVAARIRRKFTHASLQSLEESIDEDGKSVDVSERSSGVSLDRVLEQMEKEQPVMSKEEVALDEFLGEDELAEFGPEVSGIAQELEQYVEEILPADAKNKSVSTLRTVESSSGVTF